MRRRVAECTKRTSAVYLVVLSEDDFASLSLGPKGVLLLSFANLLALRSKAGKLWARRALPSVARFAL
jgi:hypothetical protein